MRRFFRRCVGSHDVFVLLRRLYQHLVFPELAPFFPCMCVQGSPLTGGPMQRDMMRALGSRIVAPWPPVLLARLFVVLQGLREQEAAARKQEEGEETQGNADAPET